MFLQIKSKKAISVLIGYVLLISFAVIMGGVVYSWMNSYVPKDALECPSGTSLFVYEKNYSESQLNLTVKNNGRFNIAGYFIYATENENQELATVDLSSKVTAGGLNYEKSILFDVGESNTLKPGEQRTTSFELNSTIYLIEIVPARFQEEEGKIRFVSCSNSIIKEPVYCG